MRKSNLLRTALLICLCLVLTAATVLSMTACKKDDPNDRDTPVTFTLKVVDLDGNETTEVIKTKKWTVGAALLDKGIISGEDGQYGLYVKEVNGITADYDKDKTYWAFYINGEYAMTGVDKTDITDGATYTLKIEKG